MNKKVTYNETEKVNYYYEEEFIVEECNEDNTVWLKHKNDKFMLFPKWLIKLKGLGDEKNDGIVPLKKGDEVIIIFKTDNSFS